jgi:hypothetical protein
MITRGDMVLALLTLEAVTGETTALEFGEEPGHRPPVG